MSIEKKKNILLICEGNDDEKLLETLLKYYPIEFNYKIYKYNTNIHLFAKYLFDNYLNDMDDFTIDELDIIQVLKDYCKKEELRNGVLNAKYTDILFVFDFDPQDPRFKIDQLYKLMDTLSNSTDQGQLYINYPMVESAIDFESLPDPNYNNKTCDLKDLKFSIYKNRVKKGTILKNFDEINESNLHMILDQTINKMNYLTNNNSKDYEYLLKIENNILEKELKIYILNSSLLFLRDYNESTFLKYISEKRN